MRLVQVPTHAKVCELNDKVFPNEAVSTSKVSMDEVLGLRGTSFRWQSGSPCVPLLTWQLECHQMELG